MASAPQNAELINIGKDGKVAKVRLVLQGSEGIPFKPAINVPSSTANLNNGRFTLMMPSKQPNNSKVDVFANPLKDFWIYKPNGGTGTLPNSLQHVAPMQMVKASSVRPQGVATSQCYIIPPYTSQANGTRVITTTQSPSITGPSMVKPPQVNVVQTILPTGNKLLTPPVRITTSHTFPRYFATQLPTPSEPLQYVIPNVVDDDDDLENLSDDDDFLKCYECNTTFETREELERHESSHLGEVNYICDKCGKEFSTKRSLQDHLQDHDTEKKFECDGCHKKFDYRDNLIFHMRIHGNLGSFKCPVCFKKFGNKSMRDNHVRKHTAEEIRSQNFVLHSNRSAINGLVKNQKLPVSNKGTPQGGVAVSQNTLGSTSKKNNLITNSNDSSGKESATSGTKLQYACTVCFKRFPDKETLDMHKLTHIKYDKRPHHQQVKNIQEAEEMKFTCRGCNKTFNSEHYQRVHEAVCRVKNKKDIHKDKSPSIIKAPNKQTSDYKVKCSFCFKDYKFGPESKDNSAQNTKFICEACCTFLAQKSQVSGFMPRLENRFICVKCDECFANENQLRDHLRSHEQNLFKCDKCGNCYETRVALNIHKAQHLIEGNDFKTKKGNNGSPGKRVSQKDKTSSKKSDSNASQQKLSGSKMSGNRKRSKRSKLSQSPRKRQKAADTDEDELIISDSNSNAFPNEEDEQVAEDPFAEEDADSKDPFAEEDDMVLKEDPFADDDDDEDPFAEVDIDNKVFIKKEPLDFEGFENTDTGNCTVFSAMTSFMPSFDIPDKIIKEEKLEDYELGSDPVKEENLNEEVTIKEELCDLDLNDFEVSIKEEKEDDECDDLSDFSPARFDFNSFKEVDARSSGSEF